MVPWVFTRPLPIDSDVTAAFTGITQLAVRMALPRNSFILCVRFRIFWKPLPFSFFVEIASSTPSWISWKVLFLPRLYCFPYTILYLVKQFSTTSLALSWPSSSFFPSLLCIVFKYFLSNIQIIEFFNFSNYSNIQTTKISNCSNIRSNANVYLPLLPFTLCSSVIGRGMTTLTLVRSNMR